MFFFLLILVIALSGFFIKGRQSQKVLCWVVMLLMMLLCGFRSESVGRDTLTYIAAYKGLEGSERFGVLWEIMISSCKIFSDDPNTFLLLMSAITFIPLTIFINKESYKPLMSVLIFMVATNRLFLETFNISRQMAAIVWVLFAVYYWMHDRRLISLVFWIFAFMLHKCTFIAWPALFLCNIKLKRNTVFAVLAVSIIVGLIGTTSLVDMALSLLMKYNNDSVGSIAVYANYMYRDMTGQWGLSETLAHCVPLSVMCALSYDSIYRKKKVRRASLGNAKIPERPRPHLRAKNYNTVYFNMFFCGTVLCNLMVSNIFCDRLSNMLTLFQIIVFANAYKCGKRREKILLSVLLLFIVLFYIRNLIDMNAHPGKDNVLPYSFYF